jgi:enoyl-CoA hydratase/carnithine racemase
MYESIKMDIIGHAAVITLNRPDAMNAFTYPMIDEFGQAITEAERDENVTGIIITGEGRGFCAGVDISTLDSLYKEGRGVGAEELLTGPGNDEMGDNFGSGFTYLMSIRKPVIAAVNGACVGFGMSVALLCDLRFASEKAKFMTSFSTRGLVAEHGQSWILPRILNPSKALDLLWSSRKVDATEAKAMGMVDRVLPHDTLLSESLAYIEKLAETAAPVSLKIMKQQVYRHLNMTLGEAMEETNRLVDESMKRDDFKEGITSYLEKRAPRFQKVTIK